MLVFPNVTKEHRGTYYCVATNVVSSTYNDDADAFVEDESIMVSSMMMIGILLKKYTSYTTGRFNDNDS